MDTIGRIAMFLRVPAGCSLCCIATFDTPFAHTENCNHANGLRARCTGVLLRLELYSVGLQLMIFFPPRLKGRRSLKAAQGAPT